jgi:YD repeat-containing protein
MGTVTYVYYPDRYLWKTFYSNNLLETRTYDNFGRLDVVKTAKIEPMTQQELQVISSFDYFVDGVGNRKEVVEQSGRKVEYKYDDLHRLLEEKVTNGT